MLSNKTTVKYFLKLLLLLSFFQISNIVASSSLDFYVAKNGSNSNPGTINLPFRTLEKARNTIRKYNKKMKIPINVYIRQGQYHFNKTFFLRAGDSGSNGHHITYRPYKNEKVVFSGAIQIRGWKREAHGIWKASVPKGLYPREFYVNGKRAIRARSLINPGGWSVNLNGYNLKNKSISNWGNIRDIEIVHNSSWKQYRCGIKRIIRNTVIMKNPCWSEAMSFPIAKRRPGAPTWIENAKELLDQPGEWYLDRRSSTLFYKPRTNEDMNIAKTHLPGLEKLIYGIGRLNTPLKNIVFKGIIFADTFWRTPNTARGMSELQANQSNPGRQAPAAAVEFRFARNIKIEENTFTRLGGMGLFFSVGVTESLVEGNTFFDISSNGMQFGHLRRENKFPYFDQSKNSAVKSYMVREIKIKNNYITKIGQGYSGASGIVAFYVRDMLFAHNEVHNVPYSGFTIGWFGHNSTLRNNRLIANKVTDAMTTMNDGGSIYVLGGQPGTIIGYNLVTKSRWNQNPVHLVTGYYFDEHSNHYNIHHNVAVDNEALSVSFNRNGPNQNVHDNWFQAGTIPNRPKQWGDNKNHLRIWANPNPVDISRNHDISSLAEVPQNIVSQAGLESSFKKIKNKVTKSAEGLPRVTAAVIATPSTGIYNEPKSINLWIPYGSNIRYTLNGTEPTCTSGMKYNPNQKPLITSNKKLRAIGCANGKPSSVGTFDYTIGSHYLVLGAGGSNISRYFTEYGANGANYLESQLDIKHNLTKGSAIFKSAAFVNTVADSSFAVSNNNGCRFWVDTSRSAFRDGKCLQITLQRIRNLRDNGEPPDLILWAQGTHDAPFIRSQKDIYKHIKVLEYIFKRIREVAKNTKLKIGIQAINNKNSDGTINKGKDNIFKAQKILGNKSNNFIRVLTITNQSRFKHSVNGFLLYPGLKAAARNIANVSSLWSEGCFHDGAMFPLNTRKKSVVLQNGYLRSVNTGSLVCASNGWWKHIK